MTGVRSVKLAEALERKYHLDYTLMRGSKIVAFVECRRRYESTSTFESWGSCFISAEKYTTARRFCEGLGVPFVFLVQTDDGLYSYTITPHTWGRPIETHLTGRNEKRDELDVEPCVLLPWSHFEQVNA